MEVATGHVLDQCTPRHRHQEFLAFLKQVARAYPRRQLQVICDNYATHKHPRVRAWLATHPRIRLHFTSTSASWLNLVEVFFSIVERQALRRGNFASVTDLIAAIDASMLPGTSTASRLPGPSPPMTSSPSSTVKHVSRGLLATSRPKCEARRVMVAIAEGLTLDETALAELQGGFRGEIVGRDDLTYDEHRKVWNGSIDRRPALIARCAGVADVVASVKLCRQHGLPVAVRSGGHSFPGLSVADDSFLIDLSLMKGVRVDPDARTARVQAGVLLGELDRETQAFGLAAPSGIVTHTGVAGLTLGGGIGWIMRKYGLSVDRLRRVDVVTAHGELVKASADENADLFWGLRGGGGNFGIVTEFEYDLVPLGPTVMAGPIFWAMEDSPEVLRFYRDWVADAPDELMTIVVHRKAPPLPFVPEQLHGKPVVMVICCWAGEVEDGERAIRPMKEFGNPVADVCAAKPFLAHQAMFDPSFPPGRWYYFKSCDVPGLTDEIIDTTVEHSLRISSPLTSFPIWQMGGAVARVGENETAFNGRNAGFTYNIGASTATAEGFDEEREWVRNFWSALEPHFTSVYVNFLMDEGEDRVRQAYGAQKYDRLKTLKRKYDPDNFFRINQNIPPA